MLSCPASELVCVRASQRGALTVWRRPERADDESSFGALGLLPERNLIPALMLLTLSWKLTRTVVSQLRGVRPSEARVHLQCPPANEGERG
jgi:hypothetical protein